MAPLQFGALVRIPASHVNINDASPGYAPAIAQQWKNNFENIQQTQNNPSSKSPYGAAPQNRPPAEPFVVRQMDNGDVFVATGPHAPLIATMPETMAQYKIDILA